jgi:hypothetical protein
MTEPAVWVAVAMALSILGLVAHNLREFGFLALFSLSTGTIPMLIIGVALILMWWQMPKARTVCQVLMIVYGLINLVAGGILTVLPLDFLPFEPEQSLSHYASHGFYSITQLPLIWIGFWCLFLNERS